MKGATARKPADANSGSRYLHVHAESGKPCRQSASGPFPVARYPNSMPLAVTRPCSISTRSSLPHDRGGYELRVTFYGVRGSTPCPCEANRRYGGNTACVALEVPGEDPIVFDIGTGLRFWGEKLPQDGSFHGTALVTHLHWDHVQGLPFFVPIDRPGATFDVYGPTPDECSWGEGFHVFMRPPYFPVTPFDLRGDIRFHDLNHDGLV